MPTRPPKPFVPGVARCVIKGTFGNPFVNIFHVEAAGGGPISPADLQSLAGNVFNAYKNHMITPLASSLAITECDATDLSSATGATYSFLGTGSGGDISSGNDPSSVACCVSWKQPLHYRGGHPRTYLPGIRPGDRADTAHFTPTFLTAMASAANSFLAAVNAGVTPTQTLVMVRYPWNPTSGTWGTPGVYPISSAAVNSRVDSQRRRLGK